MGFKNWKCPPLWVHYIDPLKIDEYGTWIVDREHKGTEDDPIHFPYPCYTAVVDELISQVYAFSEGNPDYELIKVVRV